MTNEEDLVYVFDALIACSEALACSCKPGGEDGPCPSCQANHSAAIIERMQKRVAVSASPQPSVDIKQKCINFICQNPYPAWDQLVELVESCFAAAPAQEPHQDLYVISSTGDGAQTIIVPESKLKQSVHDTYCACGLEWNKCDDEVIADTIAKVDDEEEWTREYPNYKRHVWSDHGEDYTVTIMRVAAAQEQPVENSRSVTGAINGCGCVCHTVGLFGLMCCPCTKKDLDELVNGKRGIPVAPPSPQKGKP